MKKVLLMILFYCSSCTVYFVNVDKSICIHGNQNTPQMTGSELKEIDASPENDIKTDAVLAKP
jgi:hypothetical protein